MVVVTTHRLYPQEIEELNGSDVTFEALIDFGEFLTDEELLDCDEIASMELADRQGRLEFASLHRSRSCYLKNRKVCARLEREVDVRSSLLRTGPGSK